MGRLKIEHGASKVQWTLLKTNVEASLASDIDLMCEWSNNERKYVVNELLRFALEQAEEFQKYKIQHGSNPQPSKVSHDVAALDPKSTLKSGGKTDSTGTASEAWS